MNLADNLKKIKKNSIVYDNTIKRLEKNLEEAYQEINDVNKEKDRVVELMEKAYIERNNAVKEEQRLIEIINNSNLEVIVDEFGNIIGIKNKEGEIE